MLSHFLVCMKDDITGRIYDALKNCAMINKNDGGIGLDIPCICVTGYVFLSLFLLLCTDTYHVIGCTSLAKTVTPTGLYLCFVQFMALHSINHCILPSLYFWKIYLFCGSSIDACV